jgi:integrase
MEDLQSLFDTYINECTYVTKLRAETVRGYEHVFKLLLRIIPEMNLDMLTPKVMVEFFRRLEKRDRKVGRIFKNTGIKTSTAATYRKKLNHFFKWLKLRNHIDQNPFDFMPYVAPEYGDQRWIRKEDLEKIIAAIVTTHYKNSFLLKRNLLIIYLLLFCGMRRGELVGLHVRDIDFKRKEVTIRPETSKSKRARIIPLNTKVYLQLSDYLEERQKRTLSSPYLLVSDNIDHAFTADGLKHLMKHLVKRSGVNFHPHCFRHTFAVNFLKTNRDIAKLQQILGHKDIRMTASYLRCLPTSEMRRDMEMMDVDNML